jgi:hypothetical protein
VATLVLGRRVEAELARIKASGEPVCAAELAGQPLPDASNGAIPYSKAFKLLKRTDRGGTYIDLRNCDLLSASGRNEPKTWANAREAIVTNSKALSLAEQAAAMPNCRFATNWAAGFGALFPYHYPLRLLANLAAIRAVVQARDGDMDGAAKSIALVLRMSYSTKDDATLISPLSRAAIIEYAAAAVRAAADYGQFSDAQASSLAAAFFGVDLGPSFVRALSGERAMIQTTFAIIRRHPADFAESWDDTSLTARAYWYCYGTYIGRPFFYRDQLESLRFMRKQIRICSLTYRQIRQLDLTWMDEQRAGPMTAIVCPIFVGARAGVDDATAEARGSQVFLAIQSYKRRFSAYPASLAAQKASIHWNLNTEDVFSGKDYVYRKVGRGFLLYSIGSNLKDDGGREDRIPAQGNPYDIIWKTK